MKRQLFFCLLLAGLATACTRWELIVDEGTEAEILARFPDKKSIDIISKGSPSYYQKGSSPLHIAVRRSNYGIVKYFLDLGADVNQKDADGDTALHLAVWDFEIANLLLQQGADATVKNTFGYTPVHSAANRGKVKMLETLTANGTKHINIRDDNGNTPLHDALYYPEAVNYLLSIGADPSSNGKYGNTPLHLAAFDNRPQTIKLLLAHGAELDAKNDAGETPLLAALLNGNVAVAELLITKGADLNRLRYPTKQKRKTQRDLAADQALFDQAQAIVSKGIDINKQDRAGATLLHKAAGQNDLKTAAFLIAHGAGIGIKDSDQRTPLHYAAKGGSVELLDLLLTNGDRINVKDKNYTTLLYEAVQFNDISVVIYLLSRDADFGLRIKNWDYQPLSLKRKCRCVYGQ